MRMKEALAKVRKAISRQDIKIELCHYMLRNGRLYAFDGRHTASAPVDCPGAFLVPGREFERIFDKIPDDADPVITLSASSVQVRYGRMSGTLRLTDTIDIDSIKYPEPGQNWCDLPDALLNALQLVRPFLSDNAVHSYALAASAGRDLLRATTNVSLVEVACPGLYADGQLIPCWAIDFVLGRRNGLVSFQLTDKQMSFLWDDGCWMCSLLISSEFPEMARTLFDTFEKPRWAVTEDWRQCYQLVSDRSEGRIEVHENKIVGMHGTATIEHLSETAPIPSEGVSYWDPKFLDPVVEIATHWQPDRWPGASTFRGKGIRGFIVGRRQ